MNGSEVSVMIDGVVSGIRNDDPEAGVDEFLDAFIEFVEERGWQFNGGTRHMTEEESRPSQPADAADIPPPSPWSARTNEEPSMSQEATVPRVFANAAARILHRRFGQEHGLKPVIERGDRVVYVMDSLHADWLWAYGPPNDRTILDRKKPPFCVATFQLTKENVASVEAVEIAILDGRRPGYHAGAA